MEVPYYAERKILGGIFQGAIDPSDVPRLYSKPSVNGEVPGGHPVDWSCCKIGYGGWGTGLVSLIADVELC